MRMRIVFLARALRPGGAERQLALMAAGLQWRGHDVIVATFYPGGTFRETVTSAGARHVSLEKAGRWDIVGFLLRLRSLLRQERPDILYSLLPPANIIATCATPRIAGMQRVWGIRVSDMDLGHYDWLARLSYAMERGLSSQADLIIFNARSGYRFAAERGMTVSRSAVVPNGIDTAMSAPDDVARQRMRDAWGVGDGSHVVGLIGQFDPMKDHATFFAAAATLLLSRPNLLFVLAGDGVDPQNAQLVEMVRRADLSDRTQLLGERRDISEVMAGLDVLCLSSAFGEGFPNVLGEAMASGVPCVATDVGDSPNVIGDTGEIVQPRNSCALSDALGRMLVRLERDSGEVREKARARIVENFSIERLVVRTEVLLEPLTSQPSVGDDAPSSGN